MPWGSLELELADSVLNTGIGSASSGIVGAITALLSTGTTYGDNSGGGSNGLGNAGLPASLSAPITTLAQGVPANGIPIHIYDPISQNSDPIVLTAPAYAGSGQLLPVKQDATHGFTPSFNYPAGAILYAQPTLTFPSSSIDSRFRQRAGGRIAGFGASFADGIGANSSNSPNNGTFGSGFFTKLCALSNGLLRPVANISLNGGTDGSAENLAKVGRLLAANADLVILDSGWMDHDNGAWGRTPAQQCANMATFIQICRAYGIGVIITSLPPKGPGISYSEALWQQSNLFAQNMALQNKALYVDIMSPMTTGTSSAWSANYLAGDNQHPTELGHQYIAQLVWNAIQASDLMPRFPFWLPNSESDGINQLLKGLFATASGSIAPPSWVGGGSSTVGTFGYTAVPNVPGNVLTISRSTNDGTKYIQQSVAVGGGGGQPSVGDLMLFVGQGQSLTVNAAGASFIPQATFTGATGPLPPSISPLGNTGADYTAPFTWYGMNVIPPGTTSILVRITLNNATSAAAASVAFNRVGLVDLTQQGISY